MSNWNRRTFINGMGRLLGLATVAGTAPAIAAPKGNETATPGLTTDLLKQTRLPFRIGFEHVGDFQTILF